MRSTNRKLLLTFVAFCVCVVACVGIAPFVARSATAYHQNAIVGEITAWADEYSKINDAGSARRSADMITYIARYYVPGDGYRSDPQTERRLNDARSRSITLISDALMNYTGDDSVTDPLDWAAKLRVNPTSIHNGGEQNIARENAS